MRLPGMACVSSVCMAKIGQMGRGEGESPAGKTSGQEKPPASCSGVRAPAGWGKCPDLSPVDMALLISQFYPSSPTSQPKIKPLELSCPSTDKAAMNIATKDLLIHHGGWQSKGSSLETFTRRLASIGSLQGKAGSIPACTWLALGWKDLPHISYSLTASAGSSLSPFPLIPRELEGKRLA